jgi:TolA-binding protein
MRILIPVLALGLVALPAHAGGGGTTTAPAAAQTDAEAEYRAGVVALKAKDFTAARIAFDQALIATPNDARTQYMAGVARTGLGDLKGARKFFAKATKLDPDMIAAWRDLGVTDGWLGDKARAEATLAAIQERRSRCHETCAEAAALKQADEAVSAALIGARNA